MRLWADGVVNDTGRPDEAAPWAVQHAVEDLPGETLIFLLGSRYCETDRLTEVAWNLFGQSPLGWGRVQSICDFVHRHIAFSYEHARVATASTRRPANTVTWLAKESSTRPRWSAPRCRTQLQLRGC
jgi:transglutaminase-like putative cysteine protease